MKKDFQLFVATLEDAQGIQDLLYPEYFDETAYSKLTYDAAATGAQIHHWLENNFSFVAKSEGKIVGFTTLNLTKTFYQEVEADVEMFVVKKSFRGTGVARGLVDCVVQNADANEAKIIYTSCLSGIDTKNNTLYVNLWGKYGFKTLGTVMIRS